MKLWTEAELIELERFVGYCWSDEMRYEIRSQVQQLIAIARAQGYVLPIPPMPPMPPQPPKGWKRRMHPVVRMNSQQADLAPEPSTDSLNSNTDKS